jgi:hypothetical protein
MKATPEVERLYDALENSVNLMSDLQLEEFRWLILDEEYVRRQLEGHQLEEQLGVKPSKSWN